MANAVALISQEEWSKIEKRTKGLSERAPFDVNVNINKYPATDRSLDVLREKNSTLFLLAPGPGKKLALVGAIESPVRKGKLWVASKPGTLVVTDVSNQRATLGSVDTPHVISDDIAKRLRAAGTYQPSGGTASNKRTSKKATTTKAGTVTSTIRALVAAAREEIVNEYLDDLQSDSDALIEHGGFTLTVQSVFSGMYKTTGETLAVLREIAPYVEGPGVVHRLGILTRRDVSAVDVANELVDAFAVSAIDTFGTALAALATDQPERVPERARPLLPLLEKQAAAIKKALRS